jgi:hypothetical protein
MSVDLLVQEQITIDLRRIEVEEPDEGTVEALQWLSSQLMWERQLTSLRRGHEQDRTSLA